MSPQLSDRASATALVATVITQVEILRTSQQTVVRVEGNGRLTFKTLRLSRPERLVLDFPGAGLSLARTSIPSAHKPVREVRVGQFKPGMARVVIDLEHAATYSLKAEGQSVMVAFDAAIAAPATSYAPSQPSADDGKNAARARPTELTPPPRTAATDTAAMPRREPLTQSATRPAPETKIEFSGNNVQNGMLTFRARNETLRSILEQIASKAGVAILVADGLGGEQLSVEFRQFRVDDALRQILKGDDAVFFYGADKENEGSATLKTVWVNPRDQGPGINLSFLSARKSSAKEVEGMLAHPDPEVRARAAVSLIRRKGPESSAAVLAALKDKNEGVRAQSLYRALMSGVEIPSDALVDLALNDESMNVRFLALQALPVDPTLRWVAERAANDSSQQVRTMAREILKELDAANAPTNGSLVGQHKEP